MQHVSLIVEALRTRPVGVFWAVALLQAVLWLLVPALFYTSPPGDLPAVLVVGRELVLGSWLGPPLAPWLAALAVKLTGGSIVGVYLLAQACVVTAYWATFALGRALVGTQAAVLAVMLMAGVLALSVSTPEFGPSVLALPLVALTLLWFWRALGEGRRIAWIGFAVSLGLTLLASYWGLLVAALLTYFMLISPEGRAALARRDAWLAFAAAFLLWLPHGVWMWRAGALHALFAQLSPAAMPGLLARWPLLLIAIIAAHVGLVAVAVAGSGWGSDRRLQVPEIEANPAPAFGRRFVLFFALTAPIVGALAAALLAAEITWPTPGPLVLMSGLAVVIVAGSRIALHRQDLLGRVWFGVVLAPPVLLVIWLVAVPLTGLIDPSNRQPAAAMAGFFTDIYHRRTGQPLTIVAGESRVPLLVAAASSDRPSVYLTAEPGHTPWLTDSEVRRRGGIVVWPLQDPSGQPPAAIRARFPDLVAEVPETFERPVSGLLNPLRIGWGLIRPQPVAPPVSGVDRPGGSK